MSCGPGAKAFSAAPRRSYGLPMTQSSSPTTATMRAQCTLDGKVLLTLGIPGKPAPFMSGEPFCRCTATPPFRQMVRFMFQTATAMRDSQVHTGRKANTVLGEVPDPANSTCRTTSLVTPMAGSMLPTVRTSHPGVRRQRPVRDSVAQSCIGQARCTCRAAHVRYATSARLGRIWGQIVGSPISVRGSAS